MQISTLYRKHILNGFLSVALLALLFPLQAQQSHTITVNSPANVTGEYQAEIAGFGPSLCEVDSIMGELILVDNGEGSTTACDTIVTDLSGKIALIDRGGCDFSTKVYNAQQRGAIAVLVADAQSSTDYISMAAGINADLVTIPAFFILKVDGDLIRSGLPEGVNLEIGRNDPVDDFEGEIVYEEDFSGGLNDWVATVESCSGASTEGVELWRWKGNNLVEGPCIGDGFAPGFPTQCNGFMAFESDLADSGGAGCGGAAVGTGPCPSPHVGVLTSPQIDLSTSAAAGYSVRFKQLTLTFFSQYFLSWSYDGGATWDSTAVNTDIPVNEFNAPEDDIISVPLPGSIDASSVIVRFRFEADYYFWAIDEVQIIAQEANNLQVNDNFYAISPNLLTPVSQVEPFALLADIENVGSEAQDMVNLNFTMVDTNFQVVYTADLPYGTVPANTLVENIPFDDQYTPTEVGEYLGIYDISGSLGDVDSSNNIQVFSMAVTEEQFSKEIGATRAIAPAQSEWDEGELHSWAYGNYFYVPNGDGFFMKDVSFALGDPANEAGRSFLITLYEWTEDTNNDGNMDPGERISEAFAFYVVTGQEAPGETITIPFPGEGEDPVALKNDTEYVLMLEYFASNSTDDLTLAASEDRDYGAQVFASQLNGEARYAGMLAINGDLTSEAYSSLGFGRDIVPVVRMSITGTPTNTEDLASLDNEFAVYPNPAKDLVNLQLALQQQADNAVVRLMDLAGRTLLQRDYQNVQKEFLSFNVSELPGGTYFIQVTTADGTGTKKFVVSK
ncbi:MAG TPA: PA domain-containing protein [Saprospiraceae bacterium]|nr:PA domain-containing protein [Saprospiraceae bacterium]